MINHDAISRRVGCKLVGRRRITPMVRGPTLNPGKQIPQAGKSPPTTVDPNKPVPHLVTPEGAIAVFRADGQFGDKVAIAGFSESNFGIFASSISGVGLFATGRQLA